MGHDPSSRLRVSVLVGLVLAAAWLLVAKPMHARNAERRATLAVLTSSATDPQPLLTLSGGDPRILNDRMAIRDAAYARWWGRGPDHARLFDRLGDDAARFGVVIERVIPAPTRAEVVDRASGAAVQTARAEVQVRGPWPDLLRFVGYLERQDDGLHLGRFRLVGSTGGVRLEAELVQHTFAGAGLDAPPPTASAEGTR